MIHPLMVLGFDVYAQPVSQSAAKLTSLGFDLGNVRQDTWQGRKDGSSQHQARFALPGVLGGSGAPGVRAHDAERATQERTGQAEHRGNPVQQV